MNLDKSPKFTVFTTNVSRNITTTSLGTGVSESLTILSSLPSSTIVSFVCTVASLQKFELLTKSELLNGVKKSHIKVLSVISFGQILMMSQNGNHLLVALDGSSANPLLLNLITSIVLILLLEPISL